MFIFCFAAAAIKAQNARPDKLDTTTLGPIIKTEFFHYLHSYRKANLFLEHFIGKKWSLEYMVGMPMEVQAYSLWGERVDHNSFAGFSVGAAAKNYFKNPLSKPEPARNSKRYRHDNYYYSISTEYHYTNISTYDVVGHGCSDNGFFSDCFYFQKYNQRIIRQFIGGSLMLGVQKMMDSGIALDLSVGWGVRYLSIEPAKEYRGSGRVVESSRSNFSYADELLPFLELNLQIGYILNKKG